MWPLCVYCWPRVIVNDSKKKPKGYVASLLMLFRSFFLASRVTPVVSFFFFSWWLLIRLVVTGLRVERYHSFSPGWLDFVLFWLLFARKLWRLWLWEMCWLSEASGVWVQGNWQNRVSFRGSSVTVGYCGIHGTGQPAFTLYVAYSVFDDFFTPTSSLWALNK